MNTVVSYALIMLCVGSMCIWSDRASSSTSLAHPTDYARNQAEAESRCHSHSLGLLVESPCRFCGAQHKAPKIHLKRCPVLFQASFVNLVLRDLPQDPQNGRADGEPSSPGTGGVCGGFGDKEKAAEKWEEQERKPKYSRGEEEGGKGGPWSSGSGWDPKQSWRQPDDRKQWGDQSEGTLDTQTQHRI